MIKNKVTVSLISKKTQKNTTVCSRTVTISKALIRKVDCK